MSNMSAAKIERFWVWFIKHERKIRSSLIASQSFIAEQIPLHVDAFDCGLAWEIGPGINKEYSFVLSPNGVRANLAVVDQIIKFAPILTHWEFLATKPPKKWSLQFDITNESHEIMHIDARKWKYSLIGYNKREFFDITLATDKNALAMNEQARQLAGYILLEGILGERIVLDKIGTIMVCPEKELDNLSPLSMITELPDHISKLCDV